MMTSVPNLRGLLSRLCEYDTALLANTIDYIDPTPPELLYMGGSVQCLTPEFGPIAGVAYTAELDSSTPGQQANNDLYWQQLDEISKSDVPVIWVVRAAGSRPDHECIMGDGMAKSLYACGGIAAITDGGVRDIAGMRTVPFAVYAKGTTIHHARLRFVSTGQPIEIAGLTISQGDVLHANSEGVIRIPPSCLEALPERALAMLSFEHEAHEMLRQRDIPLPEKKRLIGELLAAYGFAK